MPVMRAETNTRHEELQLVKLCFFLDWRSSSESPELRNDKARPKKSNHHSLFSGSRSDNQALAVAMQCASLEHF